MIQWLKLRESIRPYLDYAYWIYRLIAIELAFFSLAWLICFYLVLCGLLISIQYAEASCALVAAKGWLVLDIVSIAAWLLWVFDCAARMRRGSYTRKDEGNGSPN